MLRLIQLLALAGAASAGLEPRRLLHRAQFQDVSSIQNRATSGTSEPCQIISTAYEEANSTGKDVTLLAVPPSVGIACLRSVAVDKTRDLALLDYLAPFVSFQSTIEILKDPPEGYLVPAVDVLGGWDKIRGKLVDDGYESQYDVMSDLRSIFAGAYDGHFNYPPALLNAFAFTRRGLDLVSVSPDGVALPEVYLRTDLTSPVSSIDGVPVADALEQLAALNVANYQDPDAQFNALFASVPADAAGNTGALLYSFFEIPDNHTLTFRNGSEVVVENALAVLPGNDLAGVVTGDDFHERVEVPPPMTAQEPTQTANQRRHETVLPSPKASSLQMAGYPDPVVTETTGAVAGYLLNETGFEDTAVLALLSFLPLGADESSLTDKDLAAFVQEASDVVTTFIKAAKKDARDRLVIDLSANGGGAVVLAIEIYRLLFPHAAMTLFDRMRANAAVVAAARADYETTVTALLQDDHAPLGADGKPIRSGAVFAGPYAAAGGLNVTAAFVDDVSKPLRDSSFYVNGVHGPPAFADAPYHPRDVLLVTDGTCASACTILVGLLTRAQGVRAVALGGRARALPMQAMGGVKGTEVLSLSDLASAYSSLSLSSSSDIPSGRQAPLRPLLATAASQASVNAHSGYTADDARGYPVQFRYEAAQCRLFYTAAMVADPAEAWRRAAAVAWGDARCVAGSTTDDDGYMTNDSVPYSDAVRSRVAGVQGPGTVRLTNSSSSSTGTGNHDGNENAATAQTMCISTLSLALVLALTIGAL